MLLILYGLLALLLCISLGLFVPGVALWTLPLYAIAFFVALLVLHTGFLGIMSLCVNRKSPDSRSFGFYRRMATLSVEAVLLLCGVRVNVSGEELVPKKGGFLLVSNHRSGFDPLLTLVALQERELAFISKKENMDIPIGGALMLGMGTLPLDRENKRQSVVTMQQAARRMASGSGIGVYPEGTRSRNGLLGSFKNGAFKCALWAKVPIVVMTVEGSESLIKHLIKRKKPVELKFLKLIPYEELEKTDTYTIAQQVRSIMLEAGLQEEGA